jgi:hypothetical protein
MNFAGNGNGVQELIGKTRHKKIGINCQRFHEKIGNKNVMWFWCAPSFL